MTKATRDSNHFLLRVGAIGLALLLLLVSTFGASASLHVTIHPDANQTDHQCVITLFAHGQVDAATVDAAVVAPVVVSFQTTFLCDSVFNATVENLPPGRAPPGSSSQV